MDRFYIGKIGISKVNLKSAVAYLNEAVSNKKNGYVCVTNSRATYIANHEPDYLKVQNGSLLTVPDGMPLVWIAHNKGLQEMSKVSGQDLMDAIFKISVEKGYSHYFYGCSEKTLELLDENLQKRYPGLNIKGLVSPPFQPLENFDIPALAAEVNSLKPTFFWCGLGCPKQERLMAMLQPHLNEIISIGVGLAFEYYAETVKRAPVWMQKNGLEWTYRLYKQPDRITYHSMKRLFNIMIPVTKSFFKVKID